MADVANRHPSDQTLHAYGLGKLDDTSVGAIHAHLEVCPDCRRRTSALSADSFLDRVRQAQDGRGASIAPAVETLPPGLAEHPDYEVRRELGRGGMGVVYLAHNRLLGRDEVLKVMGREIMDRAGVLDRFLREMRSVARLRHPNIVTAYSAFRLGESITFAMEYIEGLDLAKLVKAKGPLPVGHACSFVHQAALGLQHAHEEGMVHRDIKPGNLMLSRRGDRGVVKVLDFGLAKATREEEIDGTLTHAGQMLGTPDYIAPEQTIDAKEADIRADIYSLGCSLYYLLTGGPPFRGTNLYDILQAHHSVDAKPLNFVRPEVPAELAAIVGKMMAKEPGRRFQYPDEVAGALTPFFKKADGARARPMPDVSTVEPPRTKPRPAVRLESGPATEPMTPVDPSPRPPRPSSMWESLIETRESEGLIEASPSVSGGRKPPWIWAALAAGVMLSGLVAAWAGGMFRVKTPEGIIAIEGLPPDADVFVDGGKVRVEWPDGGSAEITAPVGRHGVEVRKDGFRTFGEEVMIAVGEKTTLQARLEPWAKDQAHIDGTSAPPAEGANPLPAFDLLPTPLVIGDWTIEGDELVQSSLERKLLCIMFGDPDWSEYDFSLEGSVVEGEHGLKAIVHATGPLTHRQFSIGSYENTASDLSQDHAGRWDRNEGNFKYEKININNWHRINVEVRGATVRCYLDGELRFEDRDERFTHGRVGVGTWGTMARFRRIRVTAPGGEVLFEGLPKPLDAKDDPVGSPTASGTGGSSTSAGKSPAAEPRGEPPLPPAAREGWVSLFNGMDLSGWKAHPAQPGNWRVTDGILVGSGLTPSHLYSDRGDYGDIHLKANLRINDAGNSGIFARSPFGPGYPKGGPKWPLGYEAQINCLGGDPAKTGSLYVGGGGPVVKLAKSPVRAFQWFTLELIAEGNHIVVKVDGIKTADFVDENRRSSRGHVALQVYDAATHVEFRRIELKEINAAGGAGGSSTSAGGGPAAALVDEPPAPPSAAGRPPRPIPRKGTWRIEGDDLVKAGPGEGVLVLGQPELDSFDLRLKVKFLRHDGLVNLAFHHAPGQFANLLLGDWANNFEGHTLEWQARGQRGETSQFRELKIQLDQWYDVHLKVRGPRVDAAVDGVTFEGLDTGMSGGGTRIDVGSSLVHLRNIVLTSPGGEVLCEGFPELPPAIEGKPPARPADPLSPGSIWKGQRTYPRGEYKGVTVSYELHFDKFEGKKFVGHVFDNGAGRNRADVVGEVRGGMIVWSETWPGEAKPHWTMRGTLAGELIRIEFARPGENDPLKRGVGMLRCQREGSTVGSSSTPVASPSDAPVDEQPAPPAGAKGFAGRSYQIYRQELTWQQAEARCLEMGGHLAIVRNAAENQFLAAMMKAGGLDAAWLGATDAKVEGRWVWVDGTNMSYSNWGPGQPNNKGDGEDHLILLLKFNATWSDQPNSSTQHDPGFICEWD